MKHLSGGALAVLLLLSPNALAYGLKAHLWVGEQVLQDLANDCKVSLADSETELPQEVCSSIRAHPGHFLSGTLGPDLYPDLITGQVTTHPGIEDVPGRGRDAEPPQVGVDGVEPVNACANPSRAWKTSDWLRHVYDHAEPGPELAFAAGYLVHAASDVFAHTLVNAYAGDTFSLADEHNVEVRHSVIERYLDARISLDPAVIQSLQVPVEFVRDRLVLDPCAGKQAAQVGFARHVAAMSRRHSEIEAIALESEGLNRDVEARVASAAADARSAESTIESDRQRLSALASRVAELKSARQLQAAGRAAQQKSYAKLKVEHEALRAVVAGEASAEQAQQAAAVLGDRAAKGDGRVGIWHALAETERDLAQTANQFEPFLSLQRELSTAQSDLARLNQSLMLNETRLTEAKRVGAQLDRVSQANQALRSDARKWVDAMDAAGADYIRMAHATGARILAGEKPSGTEYRDWLKCHALTFSKVSYRVSSTNCALQKKVKAIKDDLDATMQDLPGPAGAMYSGLVALRKKWDAYVRGQMQKAVLKQLQDGKLSTGRLVTLLTAPEYATRERLKAEFAKPVKGRKDLVVFPDAAELIDREFQFSSPAWMPGQVPALAHAVSLSKMSLLDAAGVRSMTRSLGGVDTAVPISDSGRRYSVLYQTVRSIDGNHQWQRHGAPYWRQSGALSPLAPACRQFGYGPADGTDMGFPLYAEATLRSSVFVQVFPAPVYGELAAYMEGLPGHPDAGTRDDPFPFVDELTLPSPTGSECRHALARP